MPRHLLLYDGACGLCRRATAWARRHDRAGRLEAVPYQDAPSPPMTPALREASARAVHVITTDGRILRAGRATLFVLREVGWPRTARLLSLPPFVWGVELAYHLVARNRHWASKILFRRDGTP
jgi:predicted DCC family thiol-disulfide oxidoreductase YuxK